MKWPASLLERLMPGLLGGIILALASGCSSLPPPSAREIAGTYSSEGGIDSFVSLVLAPDETYREWFVGGTVMTRDDKGGLVMPREQRAAGTWKVAGDRVVLTARTGNSRRLTLMADGQRVWLEQPYRRGNFKFYKAAGAEPANDQPLSVTLERTVCFGTCPSYILTILADGRVTFEGREHVKKTGVLKKRIPLERLLPILEKIEAIGFWELEDSYRTKKHPDGRVSMITDLPTQFVTVKTATKSKRVEDYYGTPPGVRELEAMIDEAAGVAEWVGPADERKR